jgi:hypothetical protein
MNLSKPLALAFSLTALAGCNESYDDRLDKLESFVERNRLGESTDYFLAKKSIFGTLDKVTLVFGMLDDLEMCWELARLYESKYPSSEYTCLPGN